MRLAFVTARFGASGASPAERLAAELVARAPNHWRLTVFTTTAGESGAEPFRAGQTQEQSVRVRRFATGAAGTAELSSPALARDLGVHAADFDLIVVFGIEPGPCREAVSVAPERTVLLPFTAFEGSDPALVADFERPAAFIFGTEAEEVLALQHYGIHRRMRETVGGSLVLPQTADPAAFRARTGCSGPYLVHAGPLEPGRGVEELFRYFSTFKQRHPGEALDLVVFGPAAINVPKQPDIRVLGPASGAARLAAIAGALAAAVPERLAEFGAAAAEPFSLGVPIVVNAGASQLVADCNASNGGLYYRNYDEFELILELGLRDPALFGRMGAAGVAFLTARSDWSEVVDCYDRALRSFARPVLGSAGGVAPAAPPVSGPAPEGPDSPVPEDDARVGDEPPMGETRIGLEPPAAPVEDVDEERPAGKASAGEGQVGEPDEAAPVEESASEDAAEDDDEPEADLPGFFRSSIRD